MPVDVPRTGAVVSVDGRVPLTAAASCEICRGEGFVVRTEVAPGARVAVGGYTPTVKRRLLCHCVTARATAKEER